MLSKKFLYFIIIHLTASFIVLSRLSVTHALQPDEVLVVYNSYYTDSIYLALEYKKLRGIPERNMFNIVSGSFHRISRETYNESIKKPIEAYLEEQQLKDKILCILLVYRVPLTIDDSDKQKKVKKLEQELDQLKNRIIQLRDDTLVQETSGKIKELETNLTKVRKERPEASVDSELCLLFRNYPLDRWITNPYYIRKTGSLRPFNRSYPMYMTARLDAPNPSIVRRIMRETIATEKHGLYGNAYIDTRGYNNPKPKSAYETMDAILLQTADLLEEKGINTIVERTGKLFAKNSCPDTAIYWGWYALQNFQDSFTFVPGAIAVHIASTECLMLHATNGYWCPNLLVKGASVTIGPVDEPYLQAFPNPLVFFSALFEGFSLAEAYHASHPLLSWQMVLVGDPLYRPYKTGIPLTPPIQKDTSDPSTGQTDEKSNPNLWKNIPYQ
ncbi:MAG: TIGR03790 family protein [Candidatus Auribacterota bacterium]|nr:TIGR03790 family protein [Candidatus Auribacterota bacterium]